MAKLGAVGGLVALKVAMSRRGQHQADTGDEEPAEERPARPHPVSARKARRRRRRR